jgi:excisionase family DNA binding protein
MAYEQSPNDSVLTEAQAAEQLRMSTRRLYTLRKDGRISYIQDGQRIKYLRSQLDAYINRRTIQTREER